MRSLPSSLLAAFLLLATLPAAAQAPDAAALYARECAACHGADRFGGAGPALLPESLSRLGREQAEKVIAEGRPATQMPAFGDRLTPTQISALAAYLYTPPAEIPRWGKAEIEASRVVRVTTAELPDRPRYEGDPLNLFVLVESGDHHVSIIDGDRFRRLARFESRYALHGGPKFSPDGRFVHFLSRDGWVTRYDLWSLRIVAEVRAGINSRNLAISGDGRVLAVANYLPTSLVLLDAETLAPLEVIPVRDRWKKTPSRVSAVYLAPPRESFIVALKDLPEIWEIPYGDPPPATFPGFVHSYEKGMVEALPGRERFPIRRIELDRPLDDFFFDPSYRHLIGASRSTGEAVVVQLEVGRPIKKLPLAGMPHLGSGISWLREGRRVMATPNLKKAAISVIDMENWRPIREIPTLGPGFFIRSHENSPYAWADVFFGPNRDAVHIIDKRSLEIVRTLRPMPGKVSGHVEFDRYGRYALLSIWDREGAVIVYDARTLEEVTRIPASKPSGKYNVWNKITFSEGTSH